MLALLLYVLVAILVAVGLFVLAARFLPAGEQIAPAVRDEPPWELPPGRAMIAEDIDTLRLPVALRGYRFAETDLLLDRLAAELRERDDEIARLRTDRLVRSPSAGDVTTGGHLEEAQASRPPADDAEADEERTTREDG